MLNSYICCVIIQIVYQFSFFQTVKITVACREPHTFKTCNKTISSDDYLIVVRLKAINGFTPSIPIK